MGPEADHNNSYDGFSADLLNTALRLTTEWGENYGKPIDERILQVFPHLTADEIAVLTKRSREAEHYIYRLAEQEFAGTITESEIVPRARSGFEWLDYENASRLKSIGMFYARK
jgi:hypothetical protein